jgi:ABC-type multidrug transport system ATPase subunit
MSFELRIDHLSKTYPNGTHALKDISLAIPPGMFGLLGRNGAGKSTLMRTIATLQEPDSGTITLGDPSAGSGQSIDVIRDKERLRETLGYLPQSFGFHPRVTAERLLTHFAVMKGVVDAAARRDVVEAQLRRTNLWDVRHKRVGTFSGGMRQRLGVAIALLGNPKLIIVDEPTAGLDPEERVRFLNLLGEIGESSAVILSTHIVEDVEELCSSLAVIDRGEILLTATPAQAIAQVRGSIWRRSISREELSAFEREHAVISTKMNAGQIIAHVYAQHSPGAVFEPVEPDLKDVYFAVVGGHAGAQVTA